VTPGSAHSQFAVTVSYRLRAHVETVSVASTLPGNTVAVLRRASRVVAKATGATPARLRLAVPKAGKYRLTVVTRAGAEVDSRVVTIAASR